MGMGTEKMAVLGRHRSAFAVDDARIGVQSGRLAAQSQFGRALAGDVPRVEQIQINMLMGNVLGVGQSRHGVLGGEAGNVMGRLHRALNGRH